MSTPHHEEEARPDTGAATPAYPTEEIPQSSRQVSWFETYTYAMRIAAQHDVVLGLPSLPIAGTQQWCGLPDEDARKLLSLILGGVREALSNEIHQDAISEAGEDIWKAADWSAAARRLLRRSEIDYIRKAS
ncbi:DUF2742 domain-containing protein [Mycobacterium sp. ZZG]